MTKKKESKFYFEYELKKRFLAELAYEYFVQQNVDSISMKAFYDFGEKYFSDFDWPWENWESLLDELKRSSLVIIDEKDGSLHFRHRSFLEFFAAYQLHISPNEYHENVSTALDLYFNPFWTDIAFYFFGLKKSMILSFLNQIFDYEDDQPFALVCKMRSGRLLQACWHSRTAVKIEGLLQSSSYEQTIRNSFLEYASKEDPDMPPIFADLVLLSIASESYCSVFLKPQIEQLLHEEMPDREDAILAKLCLFAGSATLIDKEEKEKLVSRFIDALKATNNKELEGRGLLYLLCSTDEDGNARKTVSRRLKAFSRKYSSIIKGLLPTP
ncbi:hypothetical protein [Gordonibacter faecis]|uniref:HEAT repeat domain-containing protein n=2 Tax=Gordonibacter TaxID=644652 RepID=A0ABT7DLW9_9ACTN|nr:hypothetical protein [Gordonibacter sp. KGMB12511]MDJ1650530.1 hypothetical protein [Gordonibacter sp. KGMB12511]